MSTHESTSVVIVGAGPIGLELAVALKQAGVDFIHVEAGAVGSTIGWWAPGTFFFSSPERIEIAGIPLTTPDQTKATREQYLAYLRSVVQAHGLAVRAGHRVLRAERTGDGFRLTTARSTRGVGGPEESGDADATGETATIDTRSLVLAIGNMHRPRRIDVPGEDLPHVSHYFREPHHYFGRRVLVVGGKNSAVEAALRLYRCGVDVRISYRGDSFDARRVKYWLRPEIEWLIDKGRIGWHPRTVPAAIHDDHVVLETVDDASSPTTVPADFVLLLTGYIQDGSLLDQLALERKGEDAAPVVNLHTMESSVPGVYIAGTAIAGTQRRTRVFIENSHVHVERITRALTGRSVPWATGEEYAALEES